MARRFSQPRFDHPFHFHPEFEVTYIERSSGTRIVGDSIESFSPGDLCLIGAHLPHIYRNTVTPEREAISEVLQFHGDLDSSPGRLFGGAEWEDFRSLLHKARYGLQFDAATGQTTASLMRRIRTSRGLSRWKHFLDLVILLIEAPEPRPLASPGYLQLPLKRKNDRMEQACQHILEHFPEDISHRAVAQHLHLAPATFSRQFKRATRKTFHEFVLEVRLGHACRLLSESDATVAEIAFTSGFHNLSNFNRRFRSRYGCSPREYRAQRKVLLPVPPGQEAD